MKKPDYPRVLIEDWLPAAAIGVECMRERSTGQQPPDKRLHVWWARRPLTASRAAVLGSLLPADFPRDVFERLLGFGRPGDELVQIRRLMDLSTKRIKGGFGCERAFKRPVREDDLTRAHEAASSLWGDGVTVLDPMAGGGSIPLESARLGFRTLANEYNPVACSILEATVDYPFRFGEGLGKATRKWADEWGKRIEKRLASFYPKHPLALVHAYIFARTVPCPDTGFETPLVPDWHLLKPANHTQCGPACWFAVPQCHPRKGTWEVEIRQFGRGQDKISQAPRPTYDDGKGISLFVGQVSNLPHQIPADYIKAMAQQGKMGSALYTVALKARKLEFRPPAPEDLAALRAAETQLARLRPAWERANVIPTETVPPGDKTREMFTRGVSIWADVFSRRQLLAMGVLVEELRGLRPEIIAAEGPEFGEAVLHLLAFALDKFLNYNCLQARWHSSHQVIAGKMDRHDYAYKPTFAEFAPCNSGSGLAWAIDNVLDSYEDLAKLAGGTTNSGAAISLASATSLPTLADRSVTAVVVDPPYADNVQYSELADFFYVWLKRTQGHRRPEWFSSYLCEHDQEAVVNISRHRDGNEKAGNARRKAHIFYQQMMADTFAECRRVLRDDGVLTVMFTHKKQEAWEALFTSMIQAGFTISATWPIKTESEHSLHQARKNAAQSTVILVARKRREGAGTGYFTPAMQTEIRRNARGAAEKLREAGLNPVDQLVGSFGPAMEVFSRYDEVTTETGEPVSVAQAIDAAADAVSRWRIEQLASRSLDGIEPEGQFALLCWDVMAAAQFRFNEAKLLGHAVGMDVGQLIAAGLVRKGTDKKSGDKITMLSAHERARDRPLEPDEVAATLFGPLVVPKRRKKGDVLKVHPNDPQFRTALDSCHALALRYVDAGGGASGIGSARGLVRQQRWNADSGVTRLMDALVRAAPPAMWEENPKKTSVAALYPEFRAWRSLLKPLFDIEPEWKKEPPLDEQLLLALSGAGVDEEEQAELDEAEEDEEAEE